MPNPIVLATAGGMPEAIHVGGLLSDNTPSLLIDVLRTLPQEERAEFRSVASEFSSGLNATIEGSRRALMQWIAKRPSWVGEGRQQQRIRFLETLERFIRQHDLAA